MFNVFYNSEGWCIMCIDITSPFKTDTTFNFYKAEVR